MLLNLILSIFSITSIKADTLHLKADIAHDRRVLNEHGAIIDANGKRNLKSIDYYANMPLNTFSVSKKYLKHYHITKWKSQRKNVVIYQIESKIPTDTIAVLDNISDNKSDTVSLNKSFVISFRTYVIKNKKHGMLIYTTQINNRLVDFSVNGQRFSPVYEDIALGTKHPDEKAILRMIANQ